MFILIAAIGKNYEIGKNGQLIYHLKEDMNFFRRQTLGHKVVMGRSTWHSLPSKLKGRKNIVISHSDFEGPDLIVHDLEKFRQDNLRTNEEIYVIGGGAIYQEFIGYASKLYLTEIDDTDPEATVFFPRFETSDYQKKLIQKGCENGINYEIAEYDKTNKS